MKGWQGLGGRGDAIPWALTLVAFLSNEHTRMPALGHTRKREYYCASWGPRVFLLWNLPIYLSTIANTPDVHEV